MFTVSIPRKLHREKTTPPPDIDCRDLPPNECQEADLVCHQWRHGTPSEETQLLFVDWLGLARVLDPSDLENRIFAVSCGNRFDCRAKPKWNPCCRLHAMDEPMMHCLVWERQPLRGEKCHPAKNQDRHSHNPSSAPEETNADFPFTFRLISSLTSCQYHWMCKAWTTSRGQAWLNERLFFWFQKI